MLLTFIFGSKGKALPFGGVFRAPESSSFWLVPRIAPSKCPPEAQGRMCTGNYRHGAACLPLALPLSSGSLFRFSLGWQQAVGRGWLPPSPFPLMNFFQPWKTSPSGEMGSKSMERYFHAQSSLESSSSPVHLIKLNFNLKSMSKKKIVGGKATGTPLIQKSLSLYIFIQRKGKGVGCCVDLRSTQVEMPVEGFRGVAAREPQCLHVLRIER